MTKAIELSGTTPAYRDLYDERRDARKGEPKAVQDAREEALARFEEHGFPHTKLEAWKKTNPRRIAAAPWTLPPAPDDKTMEACRAAVDQLAAAVPQAAARLVLVDGYHAPRLSQITPRSGLHVQSLAEALHGGANASTPGETARPGTGPDWTLLDLNLALFTDGLHLHVEKDAEIDAPIHLIHLTTGTPAPTLSATRNQVRLAPHARATLVESYGGLAHGETWTNTATEAHIAEGARLQHAKIQREPLNADHTGVTSARIGKDGALEDLSFSLGARLHRHDIHTTLEGQGAHVALRGVFLGRREQHVDHATTIVHAVADTTSRELYKGIMDDAAHGVFTGKIVVAKDAQNTDADQQNKNLILSRKGLVDATPQLEIHADDVKCSHGSAIGQIDPAQLFYLRARGIPRQTARLVLTQAFAHQPLEPVTPGALKDHLASLVTDWFVTGNPEALKDTPRDEADTRDPAKRDPLYLPGATRLPKG